MSGRLTIRWTFGKSPDHDLSWQAFSLLHTSLRAAQLVWPDAEKVICLGSIDTQTVVELNKIVQYYRSTTIPDLRLLAAHEYLPLHLHKLERRNAWYAYAPFRLDPDGFELLLDNDVVIWREPVAIKRWREVGGILATADHAFGKPRPGDGKIAEPQYGVYTRKVRAIDPTLNLVSGVVGWGPGVKDTDFNHPLAAANARPWQFCTEQGWVAWNWLHYFRVKTYLPFESIPLITRRPRLIGGSGFCQRFDGGHWAEHNIGRREVWKKEHLYWVSKHLDMLERKQHVPEGEAIGV